jgi:hypothetical protein
MTKRSEDPALIPWYRQFWPWFIIAIPSTAVIGGMITLWLALTYPETLVVDEQEYQQIRAELKAQEHDQDEDRPGSDG